VLFDDRVQSTLHQLLKLVRPESISVFRLDQEIRTIPTINAFSEDQLSRSFASDQSDAEPDVSPTAHDLPFVPRTNGNHFHH
jgi:hypothetical protein